MSFSLWTDDVSEKRILNHIWYLVDDRPDDTPPFPEEPIDPKLKTTHHSKTNVESIPKCTNISEAPDADSNKVLENRALKSGLPEASSKKNDYKYGKCVLCGTNLSMFVYSKKIGNFKVCGKCKDTYFAPIKTASSAKKRIDAIDTLLDKKGNLI